MVPAPARAALNLSVFYEDRARSLYEPGLPLFVDFHHTVHQTLWGYTDYKQFTLLYISSRVKEVDFPK